MTTDTPPNDAPPDKVDPSTLPGYEPPVPGESKRERTNRKARNRRLAERHQKEQAAAQQPASSGKSVGGRPSAQGKRAASVTALVTAGGLAYAAIDEECGLIVIEGAPKLGDSLAHVAESNAKVRKALDSLTEVSAWGAVASAIAGIALPIAAVHRRRAEEARAAEYGEPTAAEPAPQPPPEAQTTDDDGPAFVVPPTLPVDGFTVDA